MTSLSVLSQSRLFIDSVCSYQCTSGAVEGFYRRLLLRSNLLRRSDAPGRHRNGEAVTPPTPGRKSRWRSRELSEREPAVDREEVVSDLAGVLALQLGVPFEI